MYKFYWARSKTWLFIEYYCFWNVFNIMTVMHGISRVHSNTFSSVHKTQVWTQKWAVDSKRVLPFSIAHEKYTVQEKERTRKKTLQYNSFKRQSTKKKNIYILNLFVNMNSICSSFQLIMMVNREQHFVWQKIVWKISRYIVMVFKNIIQIWKREREWVKEIWFFLQGRREQTDEAYTQYSRQYWECVS